MTLDGASVGDAADDGRAQGAAVLRKPLRHRAGSDGAS